MLALHQPPISSTVVILSSVSLCTADSLPQRLQCHRVKPHFGVPGTLSTRWVVLHRM